MDMLSLIMGKTLSEIAQSWNWVQTDRQADRQSPPFMSTGRLKNKSKRGHFYPMHPIL